jgi:hypothetical protein
MNIAERRIEINSPAVGASNLYLPLRESINPSAYVSIATNIEEIPVVCDYPDVFSDDLLGMPPDRDIQFVIELQPGTPLSGIHPGYSCNEGRIVEDGLLLEFPCTPTRTRSV